MVRKAPIRFGQSPSASDEEGKALAARLESSRAQFKPKPEIRKEKQKRSDNPADQKAENTSTPKPAAKKPDRSKNTPQREHISVRVSVSRKVDLMAGKKAAELEIIPDHIRKVAIEQARKTLTEEPVKIGAGMKQKITAMLDDQEKDRVIWARTTLLVAPKTIEKIRAGVGDKLGVYKKTTLIAATFHVMLEKALKDMG